jgi:translation initiation factor 1 (eIF-1/SUI1)
MTLFKKLSTLLAITIFTAAGVMAQVQQNQQQQAPQMPDLPTSADVSDDEIDNVVKTILDLTPIQEETEMKMEEAVEEGGIEIDRFREIVAALQNPQMAGNADVSDEEMQTLQSLQPKLMEIQGESQQQMIAKIEENGFTTERYQSIMMAAQQDRELRSRIETRLEEEEG